MTPVTSFLPSYPTLRISFFFFFSPNSFLLQDTYTLHYLPNGTKQNTTYITLHYITLQILHKSASYSITLALLHLQYSILIALDRYDNNTFFCLPYTVTHTNHADAQLIPLQD